MINYSKHAIDNIVWFHQITFPEGSKTTGIDCSDYRWGQMHQYLQDIAGKSVLEVGAWDGFFSFKAEEEGARVTACDWEAWTKPKDPTTKIFNTGRDGFDTAKHFLKSKVDTLYLDPKLISKKTAGTFDVVMWIAKLYHQQDPLTMLKRIATVCRDQFLLETIVDLEIPQDRELIHFHSGDTCLGDPTIWFVPNPKAVIGMLNLCGFGKVDYHVYSVGHTRGVFLGKRTKKLEKVEEDD